MRKFLLFISVCILMALFSDNAYSQRDFVVINDSGYELFGIMVKQDQSNYWSDDHLTTSEFLPGTSTTIIIPAGYTCQTHFKVSYYTSQDEYVEEYLAVADVCNHSGFRITRNPQGVPGNYMHATYVD